MRLQQIQNAAAKMIKSAKKYDSIINFIKVAASTSYNYL